MKKYIILLIAALSISTVSLYAQEKAGKKDTAEHIAFYACPMHPDVTMDKPGKCPKCGMDLSLSKKEEMKTQVTKAYRCPIDVNVASDKSGKCPKCGRNLTPSKKEEMKSDVMNSYGCSMHSDVVSNKPGKCPKCGMDLVEKKVSKGGGQ